MPVMQPEQGNPLPITIQPVNSAFSPGGAYYPTPVNNYGSPPVNYGYGNWFNNGGGNYNLAPSGGSSSGGGIMSPSNMGSMIRQGGQFVSNGFQLPQSTFLNNIGSNFGFGLGNVGGISAGGATESISGALAAADPSLISSGAGAVQGSLGAGGTFSSALGAAGIGALAGSFLGRIGGNPMGGSIGGGLGAGIGMAVGGPPGAIIGGLLGGIGGGFFGGKQGTQADYYGGRLNAGGSLINGKVGSKNPGDYAGITKTNLQDLTNLTSKASTALGIQFNPDLQIDSNFSSKHGGANFNIGGQVFNYDINDQASRKTAAADAFKYIAHQSGFTDDAALQSFIDAQNATAAGAGGVMTPAAPFIPIPNNQRFADFMAKFHNQGSATNVPTQATPVPVTNPIATNGAS